MIDDHVLLNRLSEIRDNCDVKRKDLLRSAKIERKTNKYVTFIAGLLSLVSAASMIAVFSDLFSGFVVKIITAALSLVSSALSLYASIFLDQNEIDKKLASATRLSEIRSMADKAMFSEHQSRSEMQKSAEDVLSSYISACADCDELLGVKIASSYNRRMTSYASEALRDIRSNSSATSN